MVYAFKAAYGETRQICDAVEQVFEKLPCSAKLNTSSRVLLKPNLLSRFAPDMGATTYPDVVLGVILSLQNRGVKDIILADSPGGLYSPAIVRDVYKACGITQVCKKTGVKLYTECEFSEFEAHGSLVRNFNLLKVLGDRDFIINIPKLKTHGLMGISGGVKNLFGLIPGLQKAEFHMRFPDKENFGQMLVDLCEAVRADMHIMDAVVSMEGNGPSGGSPRKTNFILGSEDPYILDHCVCHYAGIEADKVPALTAAINKGLCPDKFSSDMLIGEDDVIKPIENFILPDTYVDKVDFSTKFPSFMRPAVRKVTEMAAPKPYINEKACIGCGKCAEICPKDIISIKGKPPKAEIAKTGCIRCFCCHEMCPVKAIDIKRSVVFRALG